MRFNTFGDTLPYHQTHATGYAQSAIAACERVPGTRRCLSMLALIALALALLIRPAAAQSGSCTTLIPACPIDAPPSIAIAPGSMTVTSSNTVSLSVLASDDYALSYSSYTRNGVAHAIVQRDNGRTGEDDFTITLSPGANVVTAHICDVPRDGGTPHCSDASETYTYNPPPPPNAYEYPVVDTLPYSGRLRAPAACVLECFEETLSYATPPYFSLDAPRSVGLVYRSGQATAAVPVQFDVTDGSGNTSQSISLRVQNSTGYETFYNSGGKTELFFGGGQGAIRVAGVIDASSYPTGAYSRTAVITTRWADGTSRVTSVPIKMIVLNESSSAIGAGWTIAGLQRLYPSGNIAGSDANLVTDGTGGASRFETCSPAPCSSAGPPGDFSTLRALATNDVDGARYLRAYINGDTAKFDVNGRLLVYRDRFNNRTSYQYDASGHLTAIVDPVGHSTTLTYATASEPSYLLGSLRTINDQTRAPVELRVGTSGLLADIIDPDLKTALHVDYDASRRSTHWTDRSGSSWTASYAADNSLASVTAPQVIADGAPYSPVTTIHGPNSAALSALPSGGGSSAPLPRVVPDSARGSVTDPRGHSAYYRVNGLWMPTISFTRDPQGNLQTSSVTYNASYQPISSRSATGTYETNSWSGADLLSQTDPLTGAVTSYSYVQQAGAHLLSLAIQNVDTLLHNFWSGGTATLDSTKQDSAIVRYTYDSRGRVLTTQDRRGHTTTVVYQTSGLLNTASVTAPANGSGGNQTTTFAYDPQGRDSAVTNGSNVTTSTAYDIVNRVKSVTQPGGIVTHFGYNDAANTDTVVDARGAHYITVRNALGWVTSKVDPVGLSEQYAYDKNGNATSYTNRRGQAVTFAYDSLDRVTSLTADGQTTTYGYGPSGQWVSVANATTTDTVRLNAKGHMTRAVSVQGSIPAVVQLGYNGFGLPNTVWDSAGPGYVLGLGYDGGLRFNWLQDPSGAATQLVYDSDQLLSRIMLPTASDTNSRQKERFYYYGDHSLWQQQFADAGMDAVLGRRYVVDNLGRTTQIIRGPDTDRYTRTLGYDALDRLTSYQDVHHYFTDGDRVCPDPFDLNSCYYEQIQHDDVLRSANYTYDGVGNRTDLGAVIGTGNRLTSFNGYTMTYDNDGNLLSKSKSGFSQTFTWNSLGQLTQVVTNGVTTTFGYDGWGRRVRKATGATVTRYVWAGDQVIAERDGSGNLIRQYAYYPGMDNPAVVTKADGTRYYYVTEQPGQVAGVLNANGTLADSYEYTPWGEPITTSQAYDQPLRYMARDYDAETGLYYVRARYYDPQVGRFISEDPAGFNGALNLYAFAALDPTKQRDPSGLCPYGTQLEGGNYSQDLGPGTVMHDDYDGSDYKCNGDGRWVKVVNRPTSAETEFLFAAVMLQPAQPVLEGMAEGEAALFLGAGAAGMPGFTVIGNGNVYVRAAEAMNANYWHVWDVAYKSLPTLMKGYNAAWVAWRALVGDGFYVEYNTPATPFAGPNLQMELRIIAAMGHSQTGNWWAP